MLPKAIVAAFVVASGDALRVDGLHTRRTLIGTAAYSAASALSLVPLAAVAEGLKKASDAEVYARADANELKVEIVRTPVSILRRLVPPSPAALTRRLCFQSTSLSVAGDSAHQGR